MWPTLVSLAADRLAPVLDTDAREAIQAFVERGSPERAAAIAHAVEAGIAAGQYETDDPQVQYALECARRWHAAA